MEYVFLVKLDFAEVADSLLEVFNQNGIHAQLRKIPPDASYIGKIYNFTEVYVPKEKLAEAKDLLELLQEIQDDD